MKTFPDTDVQGHNEIRCCFSYLNGYNSVTFQTQVASTITSIRRRKKSSMTKL